jgi:nucleoid-associated protein YgaU
MPGTGGGWSALHNTDIRTSVEGKVANKPTSQQHVVVHGDTLWDISYKQYGDGFKWHVLYDANRDLIEDPHWIYPGQVFAVPELLASPSVRQFAVR